MRTYTTLFLLCLFPLLLTAQNSRIHVDVNNDNPTQNGETWATAYSNFVEAMFWSQPGDSLWVAAGTYHPTAGTARDISFFIRPGVRVYGGFDGTETELEERDWLVNETLFSGDIGVPGDSSDNSYHVLQAVNPDSNTVLDGLYIRHGNADGNTFQARYGGGLFVSTNNASEPDDPDARIVLRNCTFEENYARDGGALGLDSPSNKGITPTVEHCRFYDNEAYGSGGAVYRSGDVSEQDGILYQHCVFDNNRSTGSGGGIYLQSNNQDLTLVGCVFTNNLSGIGGAGIYMSGTYGSPAIRIDSCQFEDNLAHSNTAVQILYSNFGPTMQTASLHVTNSEFINNIVLSSGAGAIIYSVLGGQTHNLYVENSIFIDNKARDLNAGGLSVLLSGDASSNQVIRGCQFIGNTRGEQSTSGGAYVLNALGSNDTIDCKIEFSNCLFSQNNGAAHIIGTSLDTIAATFLNCSFYENGITNIEKSGGNGFFGTELPPIVNVQNCVFWEPDSTNLLNYFLTKDTSFPVHNEDSAIGYAISHSLLSAPDCNVPGGEDACGEGILYGAALPYLDPENGDFRLSACSPALNAGTDSLLLELGVTTDLAGGPRILDGVPDLGTYERAAMQVSIDSIRPVACYEGQDGAVWPSSTGSPPLSFTVEPLTTGTVSTSLDSLMAGSYLLFATDSTGCTDSIDFTLMQPSPISIEASTSPATPDTGGSITVQQLMGGTAPYQLLWPTGETTANISDLTPGDYTLTVTDANGCEEAFVFTVELVNSTSLSYSLPWVISPNPAQEIVRVDFVRPLRVRTHWRLGTVHGQPVRSGICQQGQVELTLSISDLHTGVYLLTMGGSDGRQSQQRIIKN